MTAHERPGAEASLLDVGQWIRATVPCVTVQDRRARQALIDEILVERRVWQRDYVWHTAQLADGRVIMALGASTEEAERKLAVLHGLGCQWVVRDPEHAVLFEYFPEGHRHPEDVNRVLALTPPRRPRGELTAPSANLPVTPHGRTPGFMR